MVTAEQAIETKNGRNQFVYKASKWYILTSLDPQDTQVQIEKHNNEQTGRAATWEYFVPYQFLERRVADELPERGKDAERDGYSNPLNTSEIKENNAIRTTLRKFIFVKATERELTRFLREEWNMLSLRRVQFYRCGDKRRVSVDEPAMNQFMAACSELKYKFDLWPKIDDLQQGEEVVLNTTGFRGEKARVLGVRQTKQGLQLTLGLDLFAGTMVLRLQNVSEKDIIRQNCALIDNAQDRHLIDKIQNQLLQILARVVNKKQTDETRVQDAAILDEIFANRAIELTDDAARRHFLALMLIGACLKHDKESVRQLTEQAAIELNAINSKQESKAATDVRTYLQVALYLSTGNAEYRNAAKVYVATHNPKSQPLRQFVKLIRKSKKV